MHPFRLLWERLRRSLENVRPARRNFELDADLLEALQGVAARERRPAREVAADLLAMALAQQNASQEVLQRWEQLSPREQQVTALVCQELTNRQIAARLGISADTVKTHMRNVLAKFDLRSRTELRALLAGWDFGEWK